MLKYCSNKGVGSIEYELTDHLGNVRLTFSDYKYETDGWKPRIKVLSKNDYFPFGMMIPENYYQDSTAKTRFKVTERLKGVEVQWYGTGR